MRLPFLGLERARLLMAAACVALASLVAVVTLTNFLDTRALEAVTLAHEQAAHARVLDAESTSAQASVRAFHATPGVVYMAAAIQNAVNTRPVVRDVNGDGADDVIASFRAYGRTFTAAIDPSFTAEPLRPAAALPASDATRGDAYDATRGNAYDATDATTARRFVTDASRTQVTARDERGAARWTFSVLANERIAGIVAVNGKLYAATEGALYVVEESTGNTLQKITQATIEAPTDVLARTRKHGRGRV